MIVADLMNKNPATIQPGANLAQALETMAAKKARHLIVLSETNSVAGILSDRDLAMYYDPRSMTQQKWEQATVASLMTVNPISMGSKAPIEEAAKLLLKSGFSALPIVDAGSLAGILTERDFVRYLSKTLTPG